jgi:hypothetical protein
MYDDVYEDDEEPDCSPGTHLFELHKTIRWTVIAWFIHAVIITIAVDRLTQMRCRKLEHDVVDLQKAVETLQQQ